MSSEGRPSLFVSQVLFDYDAQATEEITLKEGQFCHVLETNDAGWWLVREANAGPESRSGWAPSNFLRRLDADEINLAVDLHAVSPVHKTVDRRPSVKRTCHKCKESISTGFALAEGRSYHLTCFTCSVCGIGLAGNHYHMKDAQSYCEKDYYEQFGEICAACSKKIIGPVLTALNKHWHPEHFVCESCKNSITGGAEFFVGSDGKPYCENDYRTLFGVRCASCHDFIHDSSFEVQGAAYHVSCFRCCVDQAPISETDSFHIQNGAIYCLQHFQEKFLSRCESCKQPITEQFVQILGNSYHINCFRCKQCDIILSSDRFQVLDDKFVCGTCAQVNRAKRARENEIKERLVPVTMEPTTRMQKAGDQNTNDLPARKKSNETLRKPEDTTVTKPEDSAQTPKFDFQRDKDGQIRMKAADLVGKDRPLPEEIDRQHKEHYLSDEEFQSLFSMSREQFAALRPWKQQQIKQQLGLF